MRLLAPTAALLFALGASAIQADKPTTTSHAPECTATSSTITDAFFDLRPDTAHKSTTSKPNKYGVTKDYHARGFDYGKNFTLNICGAVVDPVQDVVDVDKKAWQNVSAYYESKGEIFSIGSQSVNLTSRGKKLVLQYRDGSPCGPGSATKRSNSPGRASPYGDTSKPIKKPDSPKKISDDDDQYIRRKSTTISFICDRDPVSSQATISFVGTDPDECAYFFEARSVHACSQVEPHKPGSVGPGSIFGLIFFIALLVYVIGGVCYNRTVAHARGWRQLPNFSLWAGIWSFFSDMFVILLASCTRLFPGSRGAYSNLNSNYSSRNRNSDAENRLIDQLDEEWDD